MEIAVAGFIVALLGFMFGVWKYIESQMNGIRSDLAEHKLHVAESYVTKAGMAEQTAQLLRAIEGIGNRIDSISERIDRAFESRTTRRSS